MLLVGLPWLYCLDRVAMGVSYHNGAVLRHCVPLRKHYGTVLNVALGISDHNIVPLRIALSISEHISLGISDHNFRRTL